MDTTFTFQLSPNQSTFNNQQLSIYILIALCLNRSKWRCVKNWTIVLDLMNYLVKIYFGNKWS